jgi:DNA-binding response OmpR family regulator
MEPADVPLSQSEQGELRHDLRTPFNHILGYTEMLIESGEEEGFGSLVPQLQQLHAHAKELLAALNASLAPDRALRPADLQALGQTMRERLAPLSAEVKMLLEQARQTGPAAVADLERIRHSTGTLAALARTRFLADPTATPPAVEAPAPPTEITSQDPAAGRSHSWPAHGLVLVVDDNETNRDLLCRRLDREGFAAMAAVDGGEALSMLRAGHYDLVLLDLVMPDVDGFEVLRVIKSTPALRDIPVVMISALDEMQSVVRCIEMGAEDYLPKPFDPVLLRARVSACLEKKRLRDRELEYLRGVAVLEESASAVETGRFDAGRLETVAARPDELGRLARVFQHMASEVQAREQRLKQEVAQLRIEIDMVRLSKQVEEVTAAPVFDSLIGARERLKQKKRAEGEKK